MDRRKFKVTGSKDENILILLPYDLVAIKDNIDFALIYIQTEIFSKIVHVDYDTHLYCFQCNYIIDFLFIKDFVAE